jgi:alkanesulfonate monooxygenase SsuD/methylene tetrahydromethanopterin reductase-like flavin-dependent oxidoreductase (luciferase family)
MRIAAFHLMPWPYLPENFQEIEESAWVTYSNAHYDPERGHDLYERYLSELVHCEQVGFDTICVNEHHQTAYGLMPSPNLVAMALVQRTRDVNIAIIGNALPLRDHPLRVAEEVAMLDVMSGGRIICGIVRGIGAEYHSFGLNPAHSEERFREAHDLLIDAWTKPGPFEFEGDHYSFRYVNPWPRPLQDPHPPIWVPTQGSGSTVKWAAERRYMVVQTASPLANVGRTMAQYYAAARELGYEASPTQLGWSPPVYVGKDDETARAEFAPHIDYLYNKSRHRPPAAFFPPGYLSPGSWRGVLQSRGNLGREKPTLESLEARGEIVVGGPETVLRTLREAVDATGIGTLLPMMQTGTMTHEQTIASIDRFGEQVLPALKDYLPDPPAVDATAAAPATAGKA